MNLLDIQSKDWCNQLLEVIYQQKTFHQSQTKLIIPHQECGPNLREKLGQTVSSSSDIGPISNYFVERFGFDSKCRVIAFTGDNPCSLAGMRLHAGDVACSLGTSDALFLYLDHPKTSPDGSVFCNPVQDDAYMALIW